MKYLSLVGLILFTFQLSAQQDEIINGKLTIMPSGWGNTHIPYTDGNIYLTGYTGLGSGNFIFRTYSGTGYTNRFYIKNNGYIGIGTTSPEGLFHVGSGNYGIKSTYGVGIFEAIDCQLDIISNSSGTWGSSINLIEGNGSSNADIWSIARQTTNGSGNSSLRFNYGTANNHTNPNVFTLNPNGNIGIGSNTPSTKLNVNGDQLTNRISQSGGTYTEFAQRTWSGSAGILFSAYASDTYVDGGLPAVGNTKYKFDPSSFGSTSHGAKMIFTDHSSIRFYISPASTGMGNNVEWGVPVLSLKRGGNVGIGTSTPDYKLDVLGTIRATEIKVQTTGADFVFESDYNLPTLQEVESYINQNGHLPDIPSAEEVKADGISLGEMNTKLLQKIEELTLYVIELKKENLAQDLLIKTLIKNQNED